LILIRVMCH